MAARENTHTDSRASRVIGGFIEEIRDVARHGSDRFFTWFDDGFDTDSAFVKGHCEFSFYILLPISGLLLDMKSKTALEIGYGGGRLLAAAAPFFNKTVGIDVHDKAELVSEELKKRGIRNCELLNTNGTNIPLPNASVHLVYSFIVLQHVTTISAFATYLEETWRVLVRGGYAILYFGRLSLMSRNTRSKVLYAVDRFIEAFDFTGYREVVAPVNQTNLRVSLPYAVKSARHCGFTVLGRGVSRKLPRVDTYGGQSFLILAK